MVNVSPLSEINTVLKVGKSKVNIDTGGPGTWLFYSVPELII